MKKKAQISLIIVVAWIVISQVIATKLNISLVNTWAAWLDIAIAAIPIEFALHYGAKYFEECNKSGVVILRLVMIILPINLLIFMIFLFGQG